DRRGRVVRDAGGAGLRRDLVVGVGPLGGEVPPDADSQALGSDGHWRSLLRRDAVWPVPTETPLSHLLARALPDHNWLWLQRPAAQYLGSNYSTVTSSLSRDHGTFRTSAQRPRYPLAPSLGPRPSRTAAHPIERLTVDVRIRTIEPDEAEACYRVACLALNQPFEQEWFESYLLVLESDR